MFWGAVHTCGRPLSFNGRRGRRCPWTPACARSREPSLTCSRYACVSGSNGSRGSGDRAPSCCASSRESRPSQPPVNRERHSTMYMLSGNVFRIEHPHKESQLWAGFGPLAMSRMLKTHDATSQRRVGGPRFPLQHPLLTSY